jgi:hypothetical protein
MRVAIFFLLGCLLVTANVYAERTELNDGTYVDEGGNIYENKYDNADIDAPWNDPLKKDDIFAPWNDPLRQDDTFAPWNDPMSGSQETNQYLRESGERESDYYWK